ncbi:TIGR03862 family flavoprotein [Lichenicoccus sp.]|uniref:TIGR03862 family flavoprotein n=1 Tax=Lichenicoccus sp. TaxID=2781899 RepID=UPI003D0A605F
MQQRVAIVGAGPAGLAAAERLSGQGIAVTLYERMRTPGRKLLIAGRGGLNLTHSEPLPQVLDRYGSARDWLAPAIHDFPPDALRAWAEALGQPVFTGSSGRVFPRAMKSSGLLRAWLARLQSQGVVLRTGSRWTGWTEAGGLQLEDGAAIEADGVVLALGGASWSRLGSDGSWAPLLAARGVEIAPFRPANCGFLANWSEPFATRHAGLPLQHVGLRCGPVAAAGDLMLTRRGIEGGAVYALSAPLRDAIERDGEVLLRVDLRPEQSADALAARLARVRRRESLSNSLRRALSLPPQAIGLLREAALQGPLPREPGALAALVKAVPLRLVGAEALDRAISTAGGVRREALDAQCMLRALPGLFACGEMLDWEAPTGGYLLQASLATGRAAADGVLRWLRAFPAGPSPRPP